MTQTKRSPVARQCSYKGFNELLTISTSKVTEGGVGLSAGRKKLISLVLVEFFCQPIGIEEAYKITKVEFKKLLIKKYYPRTEIQKMEDEFYHLTVKGNDLKTYVRVSGIGKPYAPIWEAITVLEANGSGNISTLQRQETFSSYAATPTKNSGYTGNRPLCKKCTMHHTGPCTIKCNTCNKVGHLARNCRNKGPATGSNLLPLKCEIRRSDEKRPEDIPVSVNVRKYFLKIYWPYPSASSVEFKSKLIQSSTSSCAPLQDFAPLEMRKLI
ncbi:reverse transcriptase domain-containing protein [Tanacetum coccineum]